MRYCGKIYDVRFCVFGILKSRLYDGRYGRQKCDTREIYQVYLEIPEGLLCITVNAGEYFLKTYTKDTRINQDTRRPN